MMHCIGKLRESGKSWNRFKTTYFKTYICDNFSEKRYEFNYITKIIRP